MKILIYLLLCVILTFLLKLLINDLLKTLIIKFNSLYQITILFSELNVKLNIDKLL